MKISPLLKLNKFFPKMDIEFFEVGLANKTKSELLEWLFTNNFLRNERICTRCNVFSKLKPYTRNADGFAWRCLTPNCSDYKKYFSIRENSFFASFTCEIPLIFMF